MKIKLLNDGGYGDMDGVKFPVEVDAMPIDNGFDVSGAELIRVGGEEECWNEHHYYYFSEKLGEVEVIS